MFCFSLRKAARAIHESPLVVIETGLCFISVSRNAGNDSENQGFRCVIIEVVNLIRITYPCG